MNVIAFVGRTCCGKSTLVSALADSTGVPVISVGQLIRRLAEEDQFVDCAYRKEHGFSSELIYSLVAKALALKAISGKWVLIEGSIGLGIALERLRAEHKIDSCMSFWLNCSDKVRVERFEKRQRTSSRIEHENFFYEREMLFDLRLGADSDALQRSGVVYEIDCSQPHNAVFRKVFDLFPCLSG